MAQYHKYSRPRGSVHDFDKALSLKDTGANILCVSDATLYAIQNLFSLDLEFKSRWAVEKHEDYYFPMHYEHSQYEQWTDLIHKMQAEVEDMSCDIVTVLESLLTQVEVTNGILTTLVEKVEELAVAETADDTLIDDIEPIMDAINVILGGAAVLGA